MGQERCHAAQLGIVLCIECAASEAPSHAWERTELAGRKGFGATTASQTGIQEWDRPQGVVIESRYNIRYLAGAVRIKCSV